MFGRKPAAKPPANVQKPVTMPNQPLGMPTDLYNRARDAQKMVDAKNAGLGTATNAPSGLRSVPMSLTQQQAQYDKNMQQAQSLPPAERAKFSEQFQRAAAAGDKSTIRPGTVFGDGSGISSLKSPNAMAKPTGIGAAAVNAANKMGMGAAAVNKLGSMGQAAGKKLGMKKGGSVSSASSRADGCAVKGKTRGKMV